MYYDIAYINKNCLQALNIGPAIGDNDPLLTFGLLCMIMTHDTVNFCRNTHTLSQECYLGINDPVHKEDMHFIYRFRNASATRRFSTVL